MEFIEYTYFDPSGHHLVELPFGTFYFCEKIFISELNEGIHFSWKMIKKVIDEIYKFYGSKPNLGYISNRINSYSMDPRSWDRVHNKYDFIIASAIVSYNNLTFMNATLEKHFSSKSIKRCEHLSEATDWILNLKELKA